MNRNSQSILSILEKSDLDKNFSDDDDVDEEDHVNICSQAIDTEQKSSESDDDNVPLSENRMELQSSSSFIQQQPDTSSRREVRLQYLGKNGTVWFKTPFWYNVRTRAKYIITRLPGVTREAKCVTSEFGVNVADDLCATYNVSCNFKRWPFTIFYALLNIWD
ncbi:unnamed protein product [Parnassius apollo]|uniref:(apollo) hypothetical protein n=1 Tax=Parnassius apollo TaxID=110799 RepID=A0A8S3XV37_PARAO|nr:unnamed protein product [Parnassius apollo]